MQSESQIRVGVIGASGFAGAEFMRLSAAHPNISIEWATGSSQAGQAVGDLYPSLAAPYPNHIYMSYEPHLLEGVDAVVLAMPHGASMALMEEIVDKVTWVIDLASDFRLSTSADYELWYGTPHVAEGLLETFAYGLPELYRAQVAASSRVAAPGCYSTAGILGVEPLIRKGLIEPERVIVNGVSGVSGAGRPPQENTTFCAVDENFTAYGLLSHRHTVEMVAHSGAEILFTPHLAPMNRGILATSYGTSTGVAADTDEALDALSDAFADEPFIVVSERIPETKAVMGSNCAHISVRVDPRTGTTMSLVAIDNLVKGTAGQAIQCLNLMAGLRETTGLPLAGVAP